jgi:tol-pal system protein YbgF
MSLKRYLLRATGLALVVGPVSFTALSQDYIDVEAERRRERQSEAEASAPPAVPVTRGTGSGTATRSYGLDGQPARTALQAPPPAQTQESMQNVGNLFIQVQQLQQEVMRLNGLVEEQANAIRELKEQSLERYMDLDRRLAGGGASMPAPVPRGDLPGAAQTAPATTVGDSQRAELPGEGDAYRSAYARVRSQEFDAAITAFKQFLERFPDGRYAPNAHYWLGELYLAVNPPAPELARQSFQLLLDAYPDNPKVPDALYKLGQVHFVKGNTDRAREFLQRVIREHGDSAAAGLAREFLDQNF